MAVAFFDEIFLFICQTYSKEEIITPELKADGTVPLVSF